MSQTEEEIIKTGGGGSGPSFIAVTYNDNQGSNPNTYNVSLISGTEHAVVAYGSGGADFSASAGQQFANWNTQSDGTGTSYDPSNGDTIIPPTSITLYAIYQSVTTISGGKTGGKTGTGTVPVSNTSNAFYIVATHPLDVTKKTIVEYTLPPSSSSIPNQTQTNFQWISSDPVNISSNGGQFDVEFSADTNVGTGDFTWTVDGGSPTANAPAWLTTSGNGNGLYYDGSVDEGSWTLDASPTSGQARSVVLNYTGLSVQGSSQITIQQSGGSSQNYVGN